jgi:hypothetical protein
MTSICLSFGRFLTFSSSSEILIIDLLDPLSDPEVAPLGDPGLDPLGDPKMVPLGDPRPDPLSDHDLDPLGDP